MYTLSYIIIFHVKRNSNLMREPGKQKNVLFDSFYHIKNFTKALITLLKISPKNIPLNTYCIFVTLEKSMNSLPLLCGLWKQKQKLLCGPPPWRENGSSCTVKCRPYSFQHSLPTSLSIAQRLVLGGIVAKWDALFSTESLWDTQVGHQGVGENQKNKGMRPLLPLHSPIAGLSNRGLEQASGWRIWGLDERRTGGWEETLQKTDPIKHPKQVQGISTCLLLKTKNKKKKLFCFPWKILETKSRNFSRCTQENECLHFGTSWMIDDQCGILFLWTWI